MSINVNQFVGTEWLLGLKSVMMVMKTDLMAVSIVVMNARMNVLPV